MANEKSKAEQYRDDRKARIAKAAKKNAHNMEKQSVVKKVLGKVISVIIIIALVLTIGGWGLSYFGVPQRLIPVGAVGETNLNISMAEYEYYYMRAYNQLINNVQQYSQYGYDYGYDTTLAPQDQKQTTKDDDGKEITWAEYLDKQTRSLIQTYKAYYKMALEKGYKLTDAEKKNIDKQLDEMKEEANSSGSQDESKAGYSLNAYLRKVYGGGVNKSFLRKQMEISTLAQKYYQERVKELKASYKQADIDAVYNKDKDAYDMVTFRVYRFSSADLTQEENETEEKFNERKTKATAENKKNADAFLAAVKDEQSFIAQAKAAHDKNKTADDTQEYDAAKDTLRSNQLKNGDGTQNNPGIASTYSEDVANWLYAAGRKVGDKTVIADKDSGTATVLYLVKTKAQTDTVNVRHILFLTIDSETQEPLSDADKAKAKKNAEDALKQWKDGAKTAESFGEIANDLSEDPGSNTTGGLYENAVQGQFEAAFDSWCFDASRKPGDTEVIETSYGYHVMYFEGKGTKYYDSAIRASKASEAFEKESKEQMESKTYEIGLGPKRFAYTQKKLNKKIKGLVELSNANSSNAAANAAGSNYSY
ncbi:MAG: peptidylprolyl isomerase [Ruminococcus sp.]|nr:peptidylprolyl isomerase [Candidatus Copronaster equi]